MIAFDATLKNDDIIEVIAGTRPIWHRVFVLVIACIELAILALLVQSAMALVESISAVGAQGIFWTDPIILEKFIEPRFIGGAIFLVLIGVPLFGFLAWSAVTHITDAISNRRTVRQSLKKHSRLSQPHAYTFEQTNVSVVDSDRTKQVYAFSDVQSFCFIGDVLCMEMVEPRKKLAIVPIPGQYRLDIENLIKRVEKKS